MFPDLRQMVAAVLASIMVLICGFGLFAAFRISHEPLSRLPSATSLQLAADNAVKSSRDVVAGYSFDRRFPIDPGSTTPSPAAAAAIVPDARAADPQTTASTTPSSAQSNPPLPGNDQTPPQSSEQAGLRRDTSPTGETDRPPPAAVAPAAEAAVGNADELPVANEVSVATTASPPDADAAAPQIAAEAAHQSSESTSSEIPAASAGVSVATLTDRSGEDAQPLLPQTVPADRRETQPKRVRHIRRAVATASQGFGQAWPGQTTQTQTFQTAPQTQVAVRRPVRVRKVASTKSKDANTGVGGPFVPAPQP
jgi:hypothetical protein